MASQRAHKQPPASQGIPCAPAWSGGTEHLSLPALIPPRMGRVGKASSAHIHSLQNPSLSRCCPPAWSIPGVAVSSKPPCGTCPFPCKPHSAARKHRPCAPAPKQQLFPLTHFFFALPLEADVISLLIDTCCRSLLRTLPRGDANSSGAGPWRYRSPVI